MIRITTWFLTLCVFVSSLQGRQQRLSCGTHPDKWKEELHLHDQAMRRGPIAVRKSAAYAVAGERTIGGLAVRPDAGNIAVLDDAAGVVARRNDFDLAGRSLLFQPVDAAARQYRVQNVAVAFDQTASEAGTPLVDLGDDDSKEMPIRFEFPFYGTRYTKLYVNSDGNLTFNAPDAEISDRSLGRLNSGEPRIAVLFRDLDPSRVPGGVRVFSDAQRLVVTWSAVPEYADSGLGIPQTVQIALNRDGSIGFAFRDARTSEAVVGISPGRLQGEASIIDFSAPPADRGFPSTIAERFTSAEEIDIFSAAQKFYLNHDDAYDYIILFNTLGISAGDGVVAYEVTVRNPRSGYGDPKIDIGKDAGSGRRLQAIVNMGPLVQYPKDPKARVPARLSVGDTPLSVIAHEVGHLFLAFASVRDPLDRNARPMLGRQTAHWDFKFNSEASLLEGNRIRDNGAGASPRFTTVATVEGFSPLDQYLMGLRAPEEVPDTFLVVNPRASNATGSPQVGVAFDGERRNIGVSEVIEAEGRRTPDHTVAQRHFRMAFVLVTGSGHEPSVTDLQQIETYRREFESYFAQITGSRATADTSLMTALHVSTFPAAGVMQGETASAAVQIEKAEARPVVVSLRSTSGAVEVPASVTIPAGATSATFRFTGVRAGVDELIATPADATRNAVSSRIQVSTASSANLRVYSGDRQAAQPGVQLPRPVQFRITDANELPYSGITVRASVTGGGSVTSPEAVTDDKGIATFLWTPGAEAVNELRASLASGVVATATALGRPAITTEGVVNAASFAGGLAPGGIATLFGVNLSGSDVPRVTVNGQPARIFYSDPRQINFLVPRTVQGTTAELRVETEIGSSSSIRVPLQALQPGLFYNTATGFGSIVVAGTGSVTESVPAAAGQIVEIYATSMGATQNRPDGLQETVIRPTVTIGGTEAQVQFSGLTPGFEGLFQVNVRIPAALPAGDHIVRLTMEGIAANEVKIRVR